MYDKIRELLEDKVTDIFVEIQNEYGITCGDCSPLDEFKLDRAEGELAEIIASVLRNQTEV